MTPSSRKTLKEYALRQLGSPVIQVNVPDIQLEDLLDDCIQFFQKWHFDGTERVYYSYQLTQDDIDNKYIDLPATIQSVSRIFPLTTGTRGNIFDIRYQLRLNDVFGLRQFDLQNYNIVMSYLSLIDSNLQGVQSYDFNMYASRLHIHADLQLMVSEDNWVMLEVYQAVNPETVTAAFNSDFMKKYFTLLVKKQWGNNLKKFDGVALVGGITLNGQKIFDEAMQEIKDFEDKILEEYQLPPHMIIG